METPPAIPAPTATPVMPYASPATMQNSDVWQESASTIVARKEAVFPPRCVKCNAAVEGTTPRTYRWHHPALYLLILVALLIYVIVALIMQQKGRVYVGVCRKHRRQRVVGLLLGWLGGIGGIVLLIAGGLNSSLWLAIGGGVLLLAAIVGGFSARILYPKKIDAYFVWLGGASRAFVATLPVVPRPSQYAPPGIVAAERPL